MDFINHYFNNTLKEVMLPLIFSNVLHMLMVKYKLFAYLAQPIYTNWFGVNKTWRGFIFLALANGLFTTLVFQRFSWSPFFYGAIMGITYMLSELPNSYIKRRNGIPEGGRPLKNKILYALLDKSDSTFGVSLMVFLLGDANFWQALNLFLFSILVHGVFSAILAYLRIKKSF